MACQASPVTVLVSLLLELVSQKLRAQFRRTCNVDTAGMQHFRVPGAVQTQHSPVAARKAAFCRLDRGHVTDPGRAGGVCTQDAAPPRHCPGLQPQLVCWGEGRAACRLRRDDSLKDIPEHPLSSVSVCLVIPRKYMFSFLAVTPTLWLGMCLCKESVFESQGHSSRVCAGGGQKRPGRRAVALSQLLLFSPYRLSLMNSNETKPEVTQIFGFLASRIVRK